MYAWFYRQLPGPAVLRVLIVVVLLVAVLLLLMEVVFPWVEAEFSPLQGEITMDTPPPGQG